MKALLAVVLAAVGAIAAGYGAFQPWQHGRVGTHIPIADAFTAPGKADASTATSVFVLIAVGIVLLAIGLFRKSPAPMFFGGLLMLLPVALPVILGHVKVEDLQAGAWQVVCGGALSLVAAGLRS